MGGIEMTNESAEAHWQRRLLPVMIVVLIGLAVFFCVSTLYQLRFIQQQVLRPPVAAADSALARNADRMLAASDEVTLSGLSWSTLATMEANVIARRYHLAHITLASRLWARYLGFITGMILALVGAAFILGKMREARSKLDLEGPAGGKIAIASSSPGLIMATLGTALMLATIVTNPEIKVKDAAVYLGGLQYETTATGTSPAAASGTGRADAIVGKIEKTREAAKSSGSSEEGGR
jgi:hypothetical protein